MIAKKYMTGLVLVLAALAVGTSPANAQTADPLFNPDRVTTATDSPITITNTADRLTISAGPLQITGAPTGNHQDADRHALALSNAEGAVVSATDNPADLSVPLSGLRFVADQIALDFFTSEGRPDLRRVVLQNAMAGAAPNSPFHRAVGDTGDQTALAVATRVDLTASLLGPLRHHNFSLGREGILRLINFRIRPALLKPFNETLANTLESTGFRTVGGDLLLDLTLAENGQQFLLGQTAISRNGSELLTASLEVELLDIHGQPHIGPGHLTLSEAGDTLTKARQAGAFDGAAAAALRSGATAGLLAAGWPIGAAPDGAQTLHTLLVSGGTVKLTIAPPSPLPLARLLSSTDYTARRSLIADLGLTLVHQPVAAR